MQEICVNDKQDAASGFKPLGGVWRCQWKDAR